jgi:ABC-type glycerol-3-phosphate transport system permease component
MEGPRTIGSWKPNNRTVAIVLFIFVFQDWNSFHWPNALSTNGEDKCVTYLRATVGFSSMVLRALRLYLHVDTEMMNVGVKEAGCYPKISFTSIK